MLSTASHYVPKAAINKFAEAVRAKPVISMPTTTLHCHSFWQVRRLGCDTALVTAGVKTIVPLSRDKPLHVGLL